MTQSAPLYEGVLARRSASGKHLVAPAPGADVMEKILFAASRAPDHGRLVPFRFVRIAPTQRGRLADILADGATQTDPGLAAPEIERVREKAQEGPLAVMMIARIDTAHPKIPVSDQWLAAGCALENILLATGDLGFAAAVKSGKHFDAPAVRAAFALAPIEQAVALIVLGTATEFPPPKPKPAVSEIVSDWP